MHFPWFNCVFLVETLCEAKQVGSAAVDIVVNGHSVTRSKPCQSLQQRQCVRWVQQEFVICFLSTNSKSRVLQDSMSCISITNPEPQCDLMAKLNTFHVLCINQSEYAPTVCFGDS